MAEVGRYLYAITRGLDSAVLAEVAGLGGKPLEVVEHRGLMAVVSEVGLDEFGEEGLRANLERLDWLEDVARGHDQVVQAVSAHGPTAPLRLATICLDDQGVRARLDEWFFALEQVLDRVEGRMEWSVKVLAPPPTPQSVPAPDAAPVGGAEYLRRKKAAATARAASDEAALQVGDEAHERLCRGAVASRRLPAQDPRLTGHEGAMLLNGAYLVEIGESAEFEALVAALVADHPEVVVDCRGPWPPYSFAMLDQR